MSRDLDRYTASVKRKLDQLASPGSRPSLLDWLADELEARRGPFALDALVASTVLPWAVVAWEIGALAGKRPEVITIGRALKKLGCFRWSAEEMKFWMLPGVDGIEVRKKGSRYWILRNKAIADGAPPSYEPKPLVRPHLRPDRALPATRLAALYSQAHSQSRESPITD